MNSDVVEVEVKGTLPTNGGCAVFLGNEEKVFVIYIDQMVGNAIMMLMKDMATERPQTHDLFSDVLKALGANVQRVVINDYIDEVFYGRLILTVENEIVEITSHITRITRSQSTQVTGWVRILRTDVIRTRLIRSVLTGAKMQRLEVFEGTLNSSVISRYPKRIQPSL